ncbi:MAG: response regulator [Candidatus Zhuqueibacterota bacterium]
MQCQRDTILYLTSRRNAIDTNLCQHILHASYRFLWASSIDDAWIKASYHDVKLVLIDSNLYGIKGIDVAKILKRNYPEIGIIILTAFEEYSPDLIKLDEGVLFFLKPYNAAEVVKAIRYLIKKQHTYNFSQYEVPVLRQSLSFN